MEDRRIFDRIDSHFPVKFLNIFNGSEGEAEAADISANGVGLITGGDVPYKTSLELWLRIPDQHSPMYTRGQVMWSRFDEELKQHRVGVRLEKAELMGLARVLWAKRKKG